MFMMSTKVSKKRYGENGKFPLQLGELKAWLYGGPYRKKPDEFYGIKMAAEIDDPCNISIPTEDYDVPVKGDLIAGLFTGITLAQQGYPLWVGCMGGIGRTGLYFAALAKVMARYQALTGKRVTVDPILYTRQHYLAHAVETKQQIEFIKNLNVDSVAKWVAASQGIKIPLWRRVFA